MVKIGRKKSTRKRKKLSKNKGFKTKRRSRSKKGAVTWKKPLLPVLGILLFALSGYIFYLDQLIDQRFDGETWARPSRVYARPLELYAGLKITPEQLIYELKLADFQPVEQVRLPGHFSLHGHDVEIFSRDFHFSEQSQVGEIVRLQLDDDRVTSISRGSSQNELDFYRLPPVMIGSFLPGNGEDRLVIGVDEIPDVLIDVLLAVEDRRFYSHWGISPLSIMRALLANIRAGKTVQGGSTLTQQLAKNMFLTPERSILRKINEAIMSLMLEMRFTKDVILSAYINEVFLLQQKNSAIHGFALASKLLFKQPLKYLSTEKLALLVGMVKGPSFYNPLTNPQRALKRRNRVLKIMHDEGQLNEAEYAQLSEKPLGVVKRLPPVNPFPAYLDLVKKQLAKNYSAEDLAEKGLILFTAFDPLKQRQLEQGLQRGLERFENKTIQAAVVVADYLNGDLVALVGDRNTDFPGYNRAIHAQRSIGSLVKPLLLYGLLSSGQTLATRVEDKPIQIKQSNNEIWAPENYDKTWHGDMTLYQAFIHSYNLPFVHLGLKKSGLQLLAGNLQKMKLLRKNTVYPSLLLGATVMTPYEVAQMFQVIASSGYFIPLTTIRQVMDKKQKVLTRVPLYSDEMFDRKTMIQVQRALIGVSEEGTARYLNTRFKNRVFAGKTGTTNDSRDAWFAGFSNRHLAVVWVGDDENRSVGLTGSSGALRIWADIMENMNEESLKLSADPTLEWHTIHRIKGGTTRKNCAAGVLLPFIKNTQPDYRSHCDDF